ncbi:MAG: NAD-dependent epimerase/dehydratase family protein [Simkania sp.]|nr:NAD-dependent epimerase/dehydratase family protein [Simkania sp.]
MRILVTGSRGFLGKFLCQSLVQYGHEVVGVHSGNCDLRNAQSLHAFDQLLFDQIFHLAAWTQAGDFCLHHPGEQWIINQQINTHVLQWWQAKQPQAKMICMGTSCGYDPELPLKEEYYLQGKPIESLFTYGMTKRMLLVGLMALHKQYGLEYLYFVPSTLYGPGYHTDGRQMHFIFDLMRKILRGKLYQEQVMLWGDGEQKRELIHVQDFVNTMLMLVEREKNSVINLGAGCEYSIKEFADKICTYIGYPKENIFYDTSKYVGARSKVLCIDKLRQLLPSCPQGNLDQGIEETTNWLLQQKEQLLPKL